MSQKTTLSMILIAAIFVLVSGGNTILMSTSGASDTRVAAGGNGSSWDTYSPQNIEISSGDSVTWYNPTRVAEPHTVTFPTNSSYFPPLAAPFSIPNDTQIIPVLPNPNVEPIFLPPDPSNSKNSTVIMDNARAYNPVAIDNTGKNVTYLQPNSNYTMSGTEAYINSGLIFPKGQSPPGTPAIDEFTVTFETPGTYGYVCILHPWMTGSVMVT
jgi:plastocyanin